MDCLVHRSDFSTNLNWISVLVVGESGFELWYFDNRSGLRLLYDLSVCLLPADR